MNRPLAETFRYNRWANLVLLEACRALTDEQLDARDPSASPSVRELLLHLVGGQQTFVLRTKGRQHEGELNRTSAFPGFDALTEIATATSDELTPNQQVPQGDDLTKKISGLAGKFLGRAA